MEKRVAKVFMTTTPRPLTEGKTLLRMMLYFLLLVISCDSDMRDDPIPYQHFNDIFINLSLPAYASLSSDGGYVYVNSGGVRGIILYRKNSSTYMAYERNCTFQPSDACATVDAQIVDMKDVCCGSAFSYETGHPTSGPAWRPLQQYRTSLSGTTLTITDEIQG